MEYLGHEYVEIAGIKWATMNIGANSVTDTGLYFQWGDTQGYTASQCGSGEGQKYFDWADYKYGNGTSSPSASEMTKYNSTDGKTVLEASDDAAQTAWDGAWRMPTEADFNNLLENTTHEWVENFQGSGVNGRLFTSKTDTSKTLFFPACGNCSNGSVSGGGSNGSYWSSSLNSSNVVFGVVVNGRNLSFNIENCLVYYGNRYCGFSVRGVFTGELKEPEDLTEEELSYSSNAAAIYKENQYTFPVLTNTHNLELSFNSSNTNVATISSNGTVSIVGNGTTTISATFAGNDDYNAKTISYTLTVDIKKYLDYEGLKTFKQKLDEDKDDINNSIQNINNKIDSLQVVNVETVTTNINSQCHITGSENSGKIEYILYTNGGDSDFIITVPTTYVTPSGSDLILTCKQSGYCEVSYINANGIIYARGL